MTGAPAKAPVPAITARAVKEERFMTLVKTLLSETEQQRLSTNPLWSVDRGFRGSDRCKEQPGSALRLVRRALSFPKWDAGVIAAASLVGRRGNRTENPDPIWRSGMSLPLSHTCMLRRGRTRAHRSKTPLASLRGSLPSAVRLAKRVQLAQHRCLPGRAQARWRLSAVGSWFSCLRSQPDTHGSSMVFLVTGKACLAVTGDPIHSLEMLIHRPMCPVRACRASC